MVAQHQELRKGLCKNRFLKTEVPSHLATAGHFFLVGTQLGAAECSAAGVRPEALGLLCCLLGGLFGGRLLSCLLGRLLGGRRLLRRSLLGHRSTSFCYDVPGDFVPIWAGAEPQAFKSPTFPTEHLRPINKVLCLRIIGHLFRQSHLSTTSDDHCLTTQTDDPSSA